MISFRCPKCGSDYELPDEQGGQKAACPCGAKFIVPSPAQESQPPPKTTQQKKISIRSTAGQRRSTSATSSTLTAGKKGFPVRAVTIVVILAIAGFGIMKMMKHAPSPVTTETTGVTAEKITPVVIPEPPKTIASGKCSSDYSDFFLKTFDSTIGNNNASALRSELEKYLLGKGESDTKDGLKKLLSDGDYTMALVQHEILRVSEGEWMKKLLNSDNAKVFLKIFMCDRDWMESLLCSGPLEPAPGEALYILYTLWSLGPDDMKTQVYRNLATATAAAFSSKQQRDRLINDGVTPIDRYEFFRDSHKNGRLHPMFSSFEPWEMRYPVGSRWDTKSLAWLQENVNIPLHRYVDACWIVEYRGATVFGDTIQGPKFYVPWQNDMNFAQNVYLHGGVCGSLSTFGVASANAHGIPAVPVGQPGHCAYAVRFKRKDWRGGFGGPDGWAHTCILDTCSPYFRIAEEIFGDHSKLLASRRHVWQSALYGKDKQKARNAFDLAVEAQPMNFQTWTEYIDFLLADSSIPKSDWEELTGRIAKSMGSFPKPMFDLVARYENKKIFAGQNNMAKPRFWKQLYQAAGDNWLHFWLDFKNILGSHSGSLGNDAAAKKELVKTLLDAYKNSDKFFPEIMGWGQEIIGSSPAGQKEWLAMLSDTLSGSSSLSKDKLRSVFNQAIIAAAKTGSMEAFQNLSKQGKEYMSNEDINVEKVNRQLDSFEKFDGELLSEGGILKTSTTSKWDTPLLHAGVLSEGGGFFHTDSEQKPWVEIQLAKLGGLSGIVIANRLEGHNGRQVPLKVSVSENGSSWTPVFTSSEAKNIWRIDLNGKNIRARYVRVERTDDRKECFHLRKILVYGRRLQ